MSEPVRIPADVLAGLEAVKESGECSMFEIANVVGLALRLGHPATADWLTDEKNHGDYIRGVVEGFEAEDEE